VTSVGASTDRGQRPYNEDAYLLRDLSAAGPLLGGLEVFMVVSDGMGGHNRGDVASRTIIDVADQRISQVLDLTAEGAVDVDPPSLLHDIVEASHAAVLAAAGEGGGERMGATFVALLATATQCWVAHVGDSRAYLVTGDEAVQLTVDHSHVGRLLAQGLISEKEAQEHPQRNVIERAVGFDGCEPDIGTFEIAPDQAVVLCTDGVSGVLSGDRLAEVARDYATAADSAEGLVVAALEAQADDNVTVAVWGPDWPGFAPAAVAAGRTAVDAARRRRRATHRRSRGMNILLILVLIGAIAGVAALAVSRPDVISGLAGRNTDRDKPKPQPTKTSGVRLANEFTPRDMLMDEGARVFISVGGKVIWINHKPDRVVDVFNRDAKGEWYRVRHLPGEVRGWVSAAALHPMPQRTPAADTGGSTGGGTGTTTGTNTGNNGGGNNGGGNNDGSFTQPGGSDW
jgi:PPM family protein phosphatase